MANSISRTGSSDKQEVRLVPMERSYDQRVKAIIAFNTTAGDLDDKLEAAYQAIIATAPQPPAVAFQERVQAWFVACFGAQATSDKTTRTHRFLEEALELAQSCDCTEEEAIQLVRYVYSRPAGEKAQEVGGVMTTLSVLCSVQDLALSQCAENELARIWTKVEQIRVKDAAKPKNSPLPGYAAPPSADAQKGGAA